MEGFLDEVMRRINLCDGFTDEDIEAILQKQVQKSHKLELPFSAYLRPPESEQHPDKLLGMLRAEYEVLEVYRRNEVERKLHETGFNIAHFPRADASSPAGKKNDGDNTNSKNKRDRKNNGRDRKNEDTGAAATPMAQWDYNKSTWVQVDEVPAGSGAADANAKPEADKKKKKKKKG